MKTEKKKILTRLCQVRDSHCYANQYLNVVCRLDANGLHCK